VLLESLEKSLQALKHVQLVHDVDAKVVQESIAGSLNIQRFCLLQHWQTLAVLLQHWQTSIQHWQTLADQNAMDVVT